MLWTVFFKYQTIVIKRYAILVLTYPRMPHLCRHLLFNVDIAYASRNYCKVMKAGHGKSIPREIAANLKPAITRTQEMFSLLLKVVLWNCTITVFFLNIVFCHTFSDSMITLAGKLTLNSFCVTSKFLSANILLVFYGRKHSNKQRTSTTIFYHYSRR